MRSLNYKSWTVICLLLLAAVCAINVLLGNDIRLLADLVLPPLVAGLTTTATRTVLITALTVAAAFATGLLNDEFLTTEHGLRVGVIVVASSLAIQTSVLRERDLRTRRRLALINSARAELEVARGLEDNLASFARAATINFADWCFLDLRLQDGLATRIVTSRDRQAPSETNNVPREEVTSVAAAYAATAEREGPILIHKAEPMLVDALFKQTSPNIVAGLHVIVLPVEVADLKATYFLLLPDPHPPWGQAELTQAESLARGAALAARSDQLIDQLSFAEQELRESRDQVSAIVQGIADGVTAQSVSGEMIFANEKAAMMFGFESAEELIGTDFSEVHIRMELRDENGDPFDAEQLPSRRAFRGEEAPEVLLRYVVRATGKEWWTQVKSRAIRDSEGHPIMAITVIEDITGRRRNDLAQRFLAEASKSLAESLDYEGALEAVARSAVPALADWCAVELVEPDGELTTAAVAHVDETRVDSLRSMREDFPMRDETFGAPEVIRTGVPELHTEIDEYLLNKLYGDRHKGEGVKDLMARSSLVAPIVVRGRPIGAITLALTRQGVRFTDFDLETALELGRRAGVAIDNARLHTERMRMLATLQQSLIPAALPLIAGLDLSARFRPAEVDAEVGGDFYDVFNLPDGSVAMVIGDVCGKGPEAASLTALARYTIRAAAMNESDPVAILRILNAALIEQVTDDRFCTVAVARIKQNGNDSSQLDVVSAGHPLPIHVSDGVPAAVGESGTLLGVVDDPELSMRSATLRKGDSLVLYTDGLSGGQTTDDLAFAIELVRGIRRNGAEDLATAIDNAAVQTQTEPNRDDVAILVASQH